MLVVKRLGEGVKINGENAGHHMAVKLLNGLSEDEMVDYAAQRGIKVYPLSKYFINGVPQKYTSTVLLGYAELSGTEIKQGIRELKQAWRL